MNRQKRFAIKLFLPVLALTIILTSVGCSKKNPDLFEETGKKIDQGIHNTGETIDKGLNKAGEKVKDATQ